MKRGIKIYDFRPLAVKQTCPECKLKFKNKCIVQIDDLKIPE